MRDEELINLINQANDALSENMHWAGSETKLIKGLIAAWELEHQLPPSERNDVYEGVDILINKAKRKYL